MAKLIKVDRNGTKYYEGSVDCPRCNGKGIYYIGVCNGRLVPSYVDQGVCFQCLGSGKIIEKWKEYTPEYEQKLQARREAKRIKYEQDHKEELAQAERERQLKIEQAEAERLAKEEEARRLEAEKLAREQAESERKSKSDYVGFIGDKVQLTLTFNYSAHYETKSFVGYGTTIKYIHNFYDENGNTFTWHTEKSLARNIGDDEWVYPEHGDLITLKGTINGHSEYKGEKQTVLTRCKVLNIDEVQHDENVI